MDLLCVSEETGGRRSLVCAERGGGPHHEPGAQRRAAHVSPGREAGGRRAQRIMRARSEAEGGTMLVPRNT